MLPFKDIYKRAINLFDDPIIQRAYVEDDVRWEKLMYPYLQNGTNSFTNPTKIAYELVDQTDPDGMVEVFEGNGGATYSVSEGFVPPDGAEMSFAIGREYDAGAKFEDGVVTFTRDVPVGKKCSVEWYTPGAFNTDFTRAQSSTTSASVIMAKVKDILAYALVLAWANDEKNFLLDIKNLLSSSDFSVFSPANSVRAKTEWVRQLQLDFDTKTNKLAWDVLSRRYHGGNYYGR